jgi:DNA-binding transcriptional ArsR family regulator
VSRPRTGVTVLGVTPRKRTPPYRRVVIDDPKTIKALAHPARLAVIDELYAGRELTATECAEIVGLSPSAMSYHLRALERAGLIERAPTSDDGRERPWRAAGTRLSVNSTSSHLAHAATTTLALSVVDKVRHEFTDWMDRSEDDDPAWRDASGVSNSRLWVTQQEAAEIEQTVSDLVDRFRGRTPADRPPGSRLVRFSAMLFPLDENVG